MNSQKKQMCFDWGPGEMLVCETSFNKKGRFFCFSCRLSVLVQLFFFFFLYSLRFEYLRYENKRTYFVPFSFLKLFSCLRFSLICETWQMLSLGEKS